MVNYDVEKFSIFISGEQSLQEMDVRNMLQKHSLVETKEKRVCAIILVLAKPCM
jgi:hypothetical protein